VEAIPAGEVVTAGKFLVNQCDALVLFDSGASHSFVSSDFVSKHNVKAVTLDKGSYCISAAENNISTNQVVMWATLEIGDRQFLADLVVLPGVGIDVILGMKMDEWQRSSYRHHHSCSDVERPEYQRGILSATSLRYSYP